MPREDDPDDGGLIGVFFTEPCEDDEGAEEALSDLTNGLRSLNIKDPATQRHIEVKVSSAPTRRFSQEPSPRGFQTRPVLEREHEPTLAIRGSAERGLSRAFPSRP